MSESHRLPVSSQYDGFADEYRDGGPYNQFYERPAMMELLGEVAGLDVLDVGCGSGVLTERLIRSGASVIGFDASQRMLNRARDRLGAAAQLWLHDLHDPLTWLASDSMDVVVGSLVMHYMKDWGPALTEFYRVLRPGGRLVFSTHHPFADFVNFNRPDYFVVEEIEDEWGDPGAKYQVRFWRRPLSVIVETLVDSGFTIEQLAEPQPSSWDGLSQKDRDRLSTNPWFLFVVARPIK